jgi:hypothetical protein
MRAPPDITYPVAGDRGLDKKDSGEKARMVRCMDVQLRFSNYFLSMLQRYITWRESSLRCDEPCAVHPPSECFKS